MKRRKNISRQTQTVLAILLRKPNIWHYGYDLMKATRLPSGTIYPMLVRLNEQGWLEAEWRPVDRPGKPARHVYRLTEEGKAEARKLKAAVETGPRLTPVKTKGLAT